MRGVQLSVIVPVYNIKQHVANGVEQLKAQSLSGEWEAVLVDDGSTDGSGELLDKLTVGDGRLRVVHQENKGAGGARNAGLAVAQGEYICFYDADDRLCGVALERIVQRLEESGRPDVLVFGYSETSMRTGRSAEFRFRPLMCRSNAEVARVWADELSGLKRNNGFTWNKVYRREFLEREGLQFGNQRIQQDEIFNHRVYERVETLAVTDDVLYHYYVYDAGNIRSRYIPERLEIYKQVKDSYLALMEHWRLDDKRVEAYVWKRFFGGVVTTIDFNCYHPKAGLSRRERREAVGKILADRDVQECVAQLDKLGAAPKNGFARQYYGAIARGSVSAVCQTRMLAHAVESVKHVARQLRRALH